MLSRIPVWFYVEYAMPRILIIDDQAHVRAAVLAALRANKFEAVGFEDGAAGLRAFEASPFDAAIVDIYMPGIDGIKLMRTLRELSPQLPIVAMSGVLLGLSDSTALDFLSKAPGLSEIVCLKKPFRSSELLEALHQAIIATVHIQPKTETAAEQYIVFGDT